MFNRLFKNAVFVVMTRSVRDEAISDSLINTHPLLQTEGGQALVFLFSSPLERGAGVCIFVTRAAFVLNKVS